MQLFGIMEASSLTLFGFLFSFAVVRFIVTFLLYLAFENLWNIVSLHIIVTLQWFSYILHIKTQRAAFHSFIETWSTIQYFKLQINRKLIDNKSSARFISCLKCYEVSYFCHLKMIGISFGTLGRHHSGQITDSHMILEILLTKWWQLFVYTW